MTPSHNVFVKGARSLWAVCVEQHSVCGVMMLDGAFGDQREWERRLSGSWASQLPLELCGQHYNLSPLLFISLPLSWSPSLNSADSKCFYARALSAVRRTDKASAVICDAQTKAKQICSQCVQCCTLRDTGCYIYSDAWKLHKMWTQLVWKLTSKYFIMCITGLHKCGGWNYLITDGIFKS